MCQVLAAKMRVVTPWPDVPEVRRKVMRGVKGKDTKPEMAEHGQLGWDVLAVWECQLKDRNALRNTLELYLGGGTVREA